MTLTPLFGRKRALLGGGGRGWSPNEKEVRGGESTPRVQGQGTGPLEPISSKRGARAALPFLQGIRASSVEEHARSHEQGPPNSAWSARPPSPPRAGQAASPSQLPRSSPRNMNRGTPPNAWFEVRGARGLTCACPGRGWGLRRRIRQTWRHCQDETELRTALSQTNDSNDLKRRKSRRTPAYPRGPTYTTTGRSLSGRGRSRPRRPSMRGTSSSSPTSWTS